MHADSTVDCFADFCCTEQQQKTAINAPNHCRDCLALVCKTPGHSSGIADCMIDWIADHRTEQQQALDTIKLQDTRLKEAFLLSKEAHYQQEQQRLNRLNEAQESEAITKLLLQAKLAPTPMTAGPPHPFAWPCSPPRLALHPPPRPRLHPLVNSHLGLPFSLLKCAVLQCLVHSMYSAALPDTLHIR